MLGVSDVPGGVVNLLSGRARELVPPLAGHRDVNAIIDATGDAAEVIAAGGRDRQARRPAAGGDYLDAARLDGLHPDRAVRRAQDRLAPGGDVAPAGARRRAPRARSTSRTPGTKSAANVTTAPTTPAGDQRGAGADRAR